MDIGTERYLEKQKTRRAVELGLKVGLIYPCDRCASTLVVNTVKAENRFHDSKTNLEEWQDQVVRRSKIGRDSVYYVAWGLGVPIVVCGECSDEIEDWEDRKVQEEYEYWPIEPDR